MSIGIGGAGSKLATLLDRGHCTVVNVSESEMTKVEATNRLLAVTHSVRGQFKGAGKNPEIGKTAFIPICEELINVIKGNLVLTASGGGSGNGICTVLMKKIAAAESVQLEDRTMFCIVLPYAAREAAEYVENTISFLLDPVSEAIDSGNTGNIILFSNRVKFEGRIAEHDFNQMLIASFREFLSIPSKGDRMKLLDGHIDHQDFNVYKTKPYFNHFTHFIYDPKLSFEQQLKENFNPLLLAPERAIEALFLLEVPTEDDATALYNILDYFAEDDVTPTYGVVLNPEISQPQINVSLLYSRKPRELVEDFKQMADKLTRKKLKKSIDQFVRLETKPLDIRQEVKLITTPPPPPEGELNIKTEKGPLEDEGENVLNILRRLKKLK